MQMSTAASLPTLELVFLDASIPSGVDPKQVKTCAKSSFLALKSFLQARPQIAARVWIQASANKYAEQWVDSWVPRRVRVEVIDGDAAAAIKGVGATSIVFLVDPMTLSTPDAFMIAYDLLALQPINTWISLVDSTPPEPAAAELRALGSRHWKTVTTNVQPVPAATRGVTLQTDFEAWNDFAKQPVLALLNNRLVVSPIPSLAMKLGAPPPLAVPWDRVASMIETAN